MQATTSEKLNSASDILVFIKSIWHFRGVCLIESSILLRNRDLQFLLTPKNDMSGEKRLKIFTSCSRNFRSTYKFKASKLARNKKSKKVCVHGGSLVK